MHIIQEDENKLIFTVYPTIYFLLGSLILISIMAYSFMWETNIFALVVGLLLLVFLILSYTRPVHVEVDKNAQTLTYEYFVFWPNKIEQAENKIDSSLLMYKLEKVIPIKHLQKISCTSKIPGLNGWGAEYSPVTVAKYQFIFEKDAAIAIYAGIFTVFTHRYAFKKIANYLNIPYEIK